MSIGATIKKLRCDKNITQGQLAELLGVSTNAVSQWECDKTAPDISHLPLLASIFEVSADVLLEIDIVKCKKQSEIKAFAEQHKQLRSQGKIAESLELCRNMQKKYPNDETVMYLLMGTLQLGYSEECTDEIIALGERLMTCANTEYRFGAIKGLCYTYLALDKREKAREYAEMIPTNQDILVHVLQGEELVLHCQNYFWKVCDNMYLRVKYLTDCAECGYTPEQKHQALKKVYDMFNIVFSDGDFGFWEDRLGRLCFFMARCSASMGNHERALNELEEMSSHFEKAEQYLSIEHTSLLVDKVKTDLTCTTRISEEPISKAYLRYLNNSEKYFKSIWHSPRFISIKEKLKKI